MVSSESYGDLSRSLMHWSENVCTPNNLKNLSLLSILQSQNGTKS
jgi:hypothetical protein